MAMLEMQSIMSLMLIKAVADLNHITLDHNINGSDVAEDMLSLIDKETARLMAIQATPNEDTSDADEKPNSHPCSSLNPPIRPLHCPLSLLHPLHPSHIHIPHHQSTAATNFTRAPSSTISTFSCHTTSAATHIDFTRTIPGKLEQDNTQLAAC